MQELLDQENGRATAEQMAALRASVEGTGGSASKLEAGDLGGASQLVWTEPLLRIAVDISKGMAFLHDCEPDAPKRGHVVLHRDLKPDNVLCTAYLQAKVSLLRTACLSANCGASELVLSRFADI